MAPSLYDRDFYAWAQEQAALLRAGRLSAADVENIAEEIESMGRSEKREMENRLVILLLHLLKWTVQVDRRGASWQASIKIQRRDLARHLRDNPSLEAKATAVLADVYPDAVLRATVETGLPEETFPATCPWSFSTVMDSAFWPE